MIAHFISIHDLHLSINKIEIVAGYCGGNEFERVPKDKSPTDQTQENGPDPKMKRRVKSVMQREFPRDIPWRPKLTNFLDARI